MDDEVKRRRQWWTLAILWLAGVVLFLPLLRNGFIGDDFTALSIYDAYKAKPFLETVLYGGNDFFRPLNMALIMARGALFGANPLPYVIANILLHLVITTLVFLTAGRIMKNQLVSAAAAVLFLVSFAHYEGITWISSSVELFAVFFIVLSVYGHVKYREHGRIGWLALALSGMILGFMTKETSVSLPFLILSYDLVIVRREERKKGFFRPYLVYGLLLALYLLVQTGWAMNYVGGDSPYKPGWHVLTNVLDYWVWLIMPNPRHPYVAEVLKILPPAFLITYWLLAGAAALTLFLTAVLAFLKKLSRPLLWSFCATLISLAVFLPFSIKISARYAYLPSFFFAILAGGVFASAWKHLKNTQNEIEERAEGKRKAKRVWQWILWTCCALYLFGNAAGLLLVEREFVKTSALTRRLAEEVAGTADFAEQDVIFIEGLPSHVHLREAVDWITGKDLAVFASNDAYRGTPRDLEAVRKKYAERDSYLYHFSFNEDSLVLESRRHLGVKEPN